ncbi:MAG: FkbM family methyltransferase [Rhodospirillales bacterium]|nr:FkbM family methyltransferase [Rhodospirillales bacterium]
MNKTTNLSIEDYAKLDPHIVIAIEGREIAFSTPNPQTVWRAETIKVKEPVTIEWIGSFNKSDTLVDVGANVGMYTLIAAVTRGVRVFAFEPEAQNYSLLIKNILRNQLSDLVIAWPPYRHSRKSSRSSYILATNSRKFRLGNIYLRSKTRRIYLQRQRTLFGGRF